MNYDAYNLAASPAAVTEVTGKTRVLGILAHPSEHVKAPPAINRIARERGKDAIMVPLNIAPDDLAGLIASLRCLKSFDGAIVTVPHKQSIVALCDDLTPQARAVGAANILRRESDGRLVGGQVDGLGFVEGLRQQGIEIAGKSIYLAGAGGAASAIAFAMAEAGIHRLTLANRSRDKSEHLRQRLAGHFPDIVLHIGTRDPSGHDIIVNATTLGMNVGDALPVDTSQLTPDMTVAEVIMEPEMTQLLVAAKKGGCRIHFGHHMLDHQLQLMANFLGL